MGSERFFFASATPRKPGNRKDEEVLENGTRWKVTTMTVNTHEEESG
jgi:hypothetical protein